jgi:Mg/Co/Ni transporter MgtE
MILRDNFAYRGSLNFDPALGSGIMITGLSDAFGFFHSFA